MRRLLLFAPLLFTMCNINAQHSTGGNAATFRKTYIPLRDSTEIYVADGDSDRLFYYALAPKGSIKGALILFPPNGQAAEETISANSALAALACDSDPDIDWQLTNRRVDFYDMNAVDGAAIINRLHLDGNEQAEFVNALGKGYRPDGTRHPHSWSLAKPEECLQWIQRCLR